MISNLYRLSFIIILMIIIFLISLSKGSTSISIYQLIFGENRQLNPILLQLRLPRTLSAFVAGGLLALAGSLMQLLLQNPLADPYVLGISGGAALLTLLFMMLGISQDWFIIGAWAGSLLTITFIFLLAHKHQWQVHTLLLAGIALSSAYAAGISLILLMSPASNLHSMLFWLSGDLNDAHLPLMGMVVLVIGYMFCSLLAPGLNILRRGDRDARALGLASKKYRICLYLLSSLFTATAVTLAGCIGFIGLIIPHFTRLIFGYDYRITLPISIILGASFLMIADTFARTLFAPEQIPVGILLAFIGVPIFIWLLSAKKS